MIASASALTELDAQPYASGAPADRGEMTAKRISTSRSPADRTAAILDMKGLGDNVFYGG
jgi:hypothetical protein